MKKLAVKRRKNERPRIQISSQPAAGRPWSEWSMCCLKVRTPHPPSLHDPCPIASSALAPVLCAWPDDLPWLVGFANIKQSLKWASPLRPVSPVKALGEHVPSVLLAERDSWLGHLCYPSSPTGDGQAWGLRWELPSWSRLNCWPTDTWAK